MIYGKPILLAGCAVIVLTGLAWTADRFFVGDGIRQETNDAYVTADFTTVAPKVSGRIDRVLAEDNEYVHAGEELAHIEDDDYRAALGAAHGDTAAAQGDVDNLRALLNRQGSIVDAAKYTVQSDEAALVFARQNAARYRNLSAGGASTIEQQQGAEARQLEKAQGALLKAQSAEHQAELNLSYCTIPAPVDGVVGERGVRVGAYVHPGTGLLAVVPVRKAYVLANFQETQLTKVQTGQSATIWVDTFPGHPLKAHVDSLAPATGVAFAAIQPDNATGNFTKVVQRVPVKLTFDPGQPLAEKVRVGMSVEARIDTSSTPEGIHSHDERYLWK
ncbi:HlyD family secretion protein [Gluconobacter roseus]|uniref:HlyD family secretion protein n=1 Tax=Gluconobacter roseus TaxID=586239 RepID=UPI0038CF551C